MPKSLAIAALPLLFALPATQAAGAERRVPFEPPTAERPAADAPPSLHARAAVADARFDRDCEPPAHLLAGSWQGCGWRGERVNGCVAAWGNAAQLRVEHATLQGPQGATLPVQTAFLRYTSAGGKLYADIIDETVERLDTPAGSCRPVWVWVDIPSTAPAGRYTGTLTLKAAGGLHAEVPLELEVQAPVLPPPAEWSVHLDLWQHPHAVARWHDVRPWSAEHIALLRPIMKRLAEAGQKVITCSVIDEAWNGQTYDEWPSMVKWIRGADGVMRYDFSDFDRYVEMMMEVGVREQISCYTMLPWSLSVRFYDEATGDYNQLPLEPGQPSYEAVWAPFLETLRDHVRAKGWLDKTCISMDERPDAYMRSVIDIISLHTPELKIVSAVNAPSKLSGHIHDMSPVLSLAEFQPGELERRHAEGKKTTFYVCMHPLKPNTYTASPLAEAEWLGLFAAANHLDGFLRWAYNSWNRNPLEKTDFVNWSPGDCWLVYPGNRSSVHFERLRDGMEDFEKIAILRAAAARTDASPALRETVAKLDAELARLFTIPRSKGDQHLQDVQRANELIRAASELLDAAAGR